MDCMGFQTYDFIDGTSQLNGRTPSSGGGTDLNGF